MHDGTMSEGSTSRGEPERRQARSDGGLGSGYTSLSSSGEESRRGDRRAPRVTARNSAFKRNWRTSAGAAGFVILSMALTGFVAIFSTVKRSRVPTPQVNEARVISPAATTPSSAQDARQSIDRVSSKVRVEETADNASGAEPKGEQSDVKPNVFFIMIDDMGWNDIGYQSFDLHGMTPNLDRLAAGGVKMTNYYSMAICTPARGSLMTGRYPVRYGLQTNVIQPSAPWGLPETEKIFPQYMKEAGYETHMVGKWHIGSFKEQLIPSQRGFDTFLGYLNDEETYWSHQSYTCKIKGRKFFDFGFGNATGYYDIIDRPLPDHLRSGTMSDGDDDNINLSDTTTYSSSVSATEEEKDFQGRYSTQVFHDRAMDILEQKTPFDEEPLYMYLAHQAVHSPLGLPPNGCFSEEEIALLDRLLDESDDEGHLRVRFAKVLMYLDHTIGEMVDYLEREGWMENSIIVVASDNGGCPGHGGSNYPLRGTKYSYWEGGNKVPAFAYSTSHIPEDRWGTVYDGLMHVTDWLPTLASAAGVPLSGAAGPFDGIDQWDHIVGKGSKGPGAESGTPRQEMLYNLDPYILWVDDDEISESPHALLAQGAFRSGKYKFISNEWCSGWYTYSKDLQEHDPLTNSSLVCEGNACSHCIHCPTHWYEDYLFDLEADPREENNVIEVYPEIAANLRERMLEVAFVEWTETLHQPKDRLAYFVWLRYNWWMVPWWDLMMGATEDPLGINSTSSTSDNSSSSSSSSISSSSISSSSSSSEISSVQ